MKKEIKISVRDLIEFVLMKGDLDLGGFASQSRAREGVRIHKKIQNSRGTDYLKEFSINKTIELENFQLSISGRIDGVFTAEDPVIIEEIKSISSDLTRYTSKEDPLHWGQAKLYALIYAEQEELKKICIQMTYYDLNSGKTTEKLKEFSFQELEVFFYSIVNKYLVWVEKLAEWQDIRNRSILDLQFPFSGYRKGQKDMAVAVYKIIRSSAQILIQAPTGIGKTAATLFPALKAQGESYSGKIFFVTARTTGKQAAVDAMKYFSNYGAKVKYVVLTAKEKICFKPESECNPAECEYAEGFFDKLPAAREESIKLTDFTREQIEELASKYRICPFEFSLDLSLWADCIIGDYNYVFDPRTKLKRFFGEDQNTAYNNFTLLADEAHNLVDRSREMFSATLQKDDILKTRRSIKSQLPMIYKTLSKINSWFLKARKEHLKETPNFNGNDLAESLIPILSKFLNMTEKWLSHNIWTGFRSDLLEIYFNVHRFLRIMELYDDNYTTCLKQEKNNVEIKLFCINPARQLNNALKAVTSAVFFSATLTPKAYFKEIFGCREDAAALVFSSPFPPENLQVFREDTVSTRYKNRKKTSRQLADVIKNFISRKKGNYLVFFPSYNYLELIAEMVISELPDFKILIQNNSMSEEDREEYLATFSGENPVTTAGFAVLGGVFGEGIDLVGNRLDGAVLVSVGLPGLSFERDIIRDYFNETGKGFEYAYKYPGIIRIMQAAGRVIRTETDIGEILLIDDRFKNYSYRSLLPHEWQIKKYSYK
ncbi:ATP-dependent DNA helicase [Candidatus Cloacimonadota bacterium]